MSQDTAKVIDGLKLFTGDFPDIRPARAKVFGELVKLTGNRIEAYHSDLYHDAVWLHDNMCGDRFTFVWSFNSSGTTIGLSRVGLRENKYEIRVAVENGNIVMWVTDLSK